MRHAISVLTLAAVLALPIGATAVAQETPTPAATPEMEPMPALQRMGAYLGTLPRFEMTADHSLDLITIEDEKIDLDGVTTYRVVAPNAFAIHSRTDKKERRYIYDGQRFTVQAPTRSVYATVDAPGTIREVLSAARDRYGVTVPLADLFHWGDPADIPQDIQSSRYIGMATLDGIQTDHYAYRRADVDWQVWIQRGEQPLPLKVVIVDRTEPTKPEYTARLSWNLNPSFNGQTFAFRPAANESAIEFAAR